MFNWMQEIRFERDERLDDDLRTLLAEAEDPRPRYYTLLAGLGRRLSAIGDDLQRQYAFEEREPVYES